MSRSQIIPGHIFFHHRIVSRRRRRRRSRTDGCRKVDSNTHIHARPEGGKNIFRSMCVGEDQRCVCVCCLHHRTTEHVKGRREDTHRKEGDDDERVRVSPRGNCVRVFFRFKDRWGSAEKMRGREEREEHRQEEQESKREAQRAQIVHKRMDQNV